MTTYQALAHRFTVRTADPALARHVAALFGGLRCAHDLPPDARYEMVEDPEGWFALSRDGELLVNSDRPGLVLAHLLWELNRRAIASAGDRVVLHAAAAERDGAGVLLAAPMEAGKTTLVAGLVRAGMRYLTDEAVAINPQTLEMEPYPKPLSVDPGSWQVLADLQPAVEPSLRPWLGDQWQVPPTSIRPDAIAPPTPVRVVVLPRYVRGGRTALEPISRARAVVELAQCTFDWDVHRAGALYTLADLVKGVSCCRLVVGDLAEACALVQRALDGEEPGGTG